MPPAETVARLVQRTTHHSFQSSLIHNSHGFAFRALIFDVGGVLFRPHSWTEVRDRWAAKMGLDPEWLQTELWLGVDIEAANVGEITAEEYASRSAVRLGCEASDALGLIEETFSGSGLDDTLVSFIREQRGTLKIGALTNNWSFGRALLERQGVADLFDDIVCSAEVGLRKPDSRIYELALERLSVAPTETIFVDDAEENIEAARDQGMWGVHFRSTDQAIATIGSLLRGEEQRSRIVP